ncbi:S9 family peptidase [Saccharolobus shibatae]|uniref:Acylamino-acid-releasing enzyme n=2 Tax=Saccharolobus shibatae TaxID=2286 RepID=A0A8F5GT23_SACSH|nr:S9 family peptidase [Saccharolobus shibatae]QXJ28455.1 Acylamino-acid-releasing enzyme [Saccharolobus shibatae B12]QXJ31784.1 Acylamino-acid-releasing enzyme [Saccharolobus shibatae]
MEYAELVKLLEETVKIPIYGVLGKLRNNLIYLATSEGEISIYALVNGKSVKLTKSPIAVTTRPKSNLDFIPFARDVEKGKEIHAVYIANLKGEEFQIESPRVRISSLAYDSKRIVLTGSSQSETSIYVIENGKLSKLTTIPPFSFVTDINEKCIIGSGVLKGNPRSQEFFIINFSGEMQVLTPKEGSVTNAYYLMGNKVYLISDYETLGESYWVYTYDIESKEYKRVEIPIEFKPVEIYYDPEDSLVIAKRDGESRLFDNGKEIKTPRGTISGATRIGDEIYFSHSSLVSPYKIYKANREGKTEIVVDNRKVDMGELDYVKLKTDVDVPAWVIKRKVPGSTIIYVHGGPWSEVDNSWDLLIAPLVLAGYNVIAPNYRGSTGYGSRFMLMNIGDPGGGDLRDVVKVRDYAVESGIANKVGIMGYSYGGYMTLLAVGKEASKWDFGIAGAAVADWVEMYDLSDSLFRGFMEILFNGKNIELMRERSPITYASNVKVPLCIIHSQNDTRTPLSPVMRYVQELHKNGKTYEFHVIPNLGHAIYKVEDAIDLLLPALIFLKKLNRG